MKATVFACVVLLLSPGPALACGTDTDCRIGERSYRIALPEPVPAGKKIGAIVYAHGYRGRADRVMKNKGLLKVARDLGVALIVVKSAGDDWSIPGAPTQSTIPGTDELVYFDRVVEDATSRFPIDRKRLLATGFSAGGMMVWNLACFRGDLFAGFAPMAGTFWSPIPRTCPSAPVNLFHYHGTRDPIVPMAGRPIGAAQQGNVQTAADLLRKDGSYGPAGETGLSDKGLDCRRRQAMDKKTGAAKIFDLCLHEGKHEFRTGFVKRSWKQLQAIGAL